MLQKDELLLAMLDGATGSTSSGTGTSNERALDHLMQTPPSVDEFASLCDFMGHLQDEQAGALDMSFTSAMDSQHAELAAACYIARTNAIHALKMRSRPSEGPPKKRKATYHVRKVLYS